MAVKSHFRILRSSCLHIDDDVQPQTLGNPIQLPHKYWRAWVREWNLEGLPQLTDFPPLVETLVKSDNTQPTMGYSSNIRPSKPSISLPLFSANWFLGNTLLLSPSQPCLAKFQNPNLHPSILPPFTPHLRHKSSFPNTFSVPCFWGHHIYIFRCDPSGLAISGHILLSKTTSIRNCFSLHPTQFVVSILFHCFLEIYFF